MKTIVNWQLPIKTASESNSSEHWTVKRKRHKIQQGWVNMVFLQDKPIVEIPCNIVVTRIAPRSLDSHDNLPMSLKWICDSIADNIFPGKAAGRADDCKDIKWEYRQKKGKPREYAVEIEIQREE
jgi:hypothetical protein